jgi:hypothetical protein
MAIKKAQGGATTKQPTKVAKKPISVSQAIGDLTLRDFKNATERSLNLVTLGGYKAAKKKVKEVTGMKSGGTIKKAQGGTSLGMKSVKAGFDNNPGVTRADIITAATKKAKTGTTIPKKNSVSKNIGNLNKAKSGKSMKTCKGGC